MKKTIRLMLTAATLAALATPGVAPARDAAAPAKPVPAAAKRPNIIFVLTDDQRYDALGFLDPTLKTPNIDRMAKEGAYFPNAFVTTALCSPSRASIMTGQYMHRHGIADNNIKFRPGTQFFSTALQRAGYATAFVGKWHMGGHSDAPQAGFDHWVSFAGQGNYLPDNGQGGPRHKLNVDGKRVEQRGYITDDLNNYALTWLRDRKGEQPFFLYLSHKAVHSDFIPADRDKDKYKGERIPLPETLADTPANYAGKPMWVKNQRNSWHGVDFPYHSRLDVEEYKRRYYQTLGAVDDGIGQIFDELKRQGKLDNTIVILMGDNGFMFGEHGLIDKRNAYEESMRVPLVVYGGGGPKGRTVKEMVANIDWAPTFVELAGAKPNATYDGMSFASLIRGQKPVNWRSSLLYEYYWEYNYPHTPTTFALRTDQYKLIQYHGIWDTEELYDLAVDPKETRNLIDDPAQQARIAKLREELFARLDQGDARSSITFTERRGVGAVLRARDGSKAAEFPDSWLRKPGDPDLKRHIANEGGKRVGTTGAEH